MKKLASNYIMWFSSIVKYVKHDIQMVINERTGDRYVIYSVYLNIYI